jgi:SAM-dependent methyltransferase
MTGIRPEILEHYNEGREAARLIDGSVGGPLEFERTLELLGRFLPPAPARILDVGGGPGQYAAWLAERGCDVLLVDPVPLHVEQARARALCAEIGDARSLSQPDGSADVVLLMGPLYHLTEAADRERSLGEARRVLRPGGLLIAAAIGRYAALLDMLVRLDRIHEPGVSACVEDSVRSGIFRGYEHGLFTTAFFHLPEQLRDEITAAGLGSCELFNVEGPGFVVSDLDSRWQDPERREALLNAARLIESDAAMLASASHLLAVARAPDQPLTQAVRD